MLQLQAEVEDGEGGEKGGGRGGEQQQQQYKGGGKEGVTSEEKQSGRFTIHPHSFQLLKKPCCLQYVLYNISLMMTFTDSSQMNQGMRAVNNFVLKQSFVLFKPKSAVASVRD